MLEKILFSIVIILLIFCASSLLLLGVDLVFGETITYHAMIIDKQYCAESSGVGTGVGSNGGVAVVSTYSSEKFILLCDADGQLITKEVNPEYFIKSKIGDEIEIDKRVGYITKIVY